jgi:predicted GNAT family acetyltransferase
MTILPLTRARWADLEAVFMARGCSVARGCWCMFYRQEGTRLGGAERARKNKAELKALVAAGKEPGLIAYEGEKPVGWVTLGPREDFKRLKNSRVMKAVDHTPVWSVVCFVVPSEHRGRGVAKALLKGAIKHAREKAAKVLEAYPIDKPGPSSPNDLWFGTKSMYDAAGFSVAARRKPERPVVRLAL